MKTNYSELESIIYRYNSLTSTQAEAKRLALNGIQTAIVTANEQTSGKGRCDRSWESPRDGGLYVSFLVRPRIHPSNIHLINLAAGLAVASFLRYSYGISAALKWPNDVIIEEEGTIKKICGILSEASIYDAEVKFCIVGIGINCKRESIPAELSRRACALDEYVNNIDKKDLLKGISSELFSRIENFELQGAEKILQEYIPFCTTIGRAVQIETGERTINGTAIGIGQSGELLAETKNGVEKFSSGDVFHATI